MKFGQAVVGLSHTIFLEPDFFLCISPHFDR